MRRYLYTIALLIIAILITITDAKSLQDGDIIFQTSQSSQSQAIQLVTKSKYSHMGIIFHKKG